MIPVTLLPMGGSAVLAEVAAAGEVLALRDALAGSRPHGVIDLVPAARTVLVQFDARVLTPAAAREWIERVADAADQAAEPPPGEPTVLPVRYDGPDLEATARLLGIGPAELVARHAAATWRVAFIGFAPGFGYLASPDWDHNVPRLDTPRTRVPAGSVGLAGTYSGAYPRETPGGWRLIGTTSAALFDQAARDPVLLAPGDRVVFRPEGDTA